MMNSHSLKMILNLQEIYNNRNKNNKLCCEETCFLYLRKTKARSAAIAQADHLLCYSYEPRYEAFCIGENKDADQLRGNREADQRLCFRSSDSTIHLLSKSEISSL